ncbi:MAG: NAD(P)H-dependent glycerol-3-phosphate dehydrogenase [Leptolyngbyaceae bacterium]|nr:NAD(P)H-dependent glycerol-3-phosphate dehydrogenase [Leptolyngbyaceae bacterium]
MVAVTVLGAGVWGSSLARLATVAGQEVTVWSRRGSLALETAIAQAEVMVSAISMKGVADLAQQVSQLPLRENTIVVTATKGLDPATTQTPSHIWQQALPHHPIVVLSGPNLSKEIDQDLPAATVAACTNPAAAETIQTIFSSSTFRVYTNTDPIGTELGGTLKNVIAIAVGVCDGLQLGTNAKSALITRAMTEVIRVGTTLGGRPETFMGLSGLGDLLATCSSALSRNYQVGFGLAQGESLDDILTHLQGTAEGVNTANVLIDVAQREKILIPISYTVYQLLNGQITAKEAIALLMERDLKPEALDLNSQP